MPRLNTPIVLSIINDIKELVFVSNELYSWIGDIEHQSWKFPTKSGRNINVLEIVELHRGSAGEMYILLLELAYDRINFVLRLIIEFMDIYPSVEDFTKEMKNVKRPKYMSIAALIRLIWDRLKRFPDSISKKMAKMKGVDSESFVEKISRSTQAVGDRGCFKHCRSCSLAASTILDLINGIEATFLEYKLHSAAAEQRELSKFGLWDKSQWAVMSKLAEAINQDVRIILELVRDNARINESVKRDRDNTVKRIQVDMKNKISEFDKLKVKNVELKKEIKSVTAELEEMQKNKLEMNQKNLELTSALQEARKNMSVLADCNQLVQNQLVEISDTKIALERTIQALKTELDLKEEKCVEIEKLQGSIMELEKENKFIKTEFECKIEQLATNCLTSRNNQNCRCTASDEKLIKSNSSSYSQVKKAVKSDDNPEADMTQQFNSNQQKIKELVRQNERLSKTLDRLREHRLREIVRSDEGH
ncbi:interaptin-like [Belonocnema kinseyi]|uniref:interaptin-like n=1 Tax=Belonocnema kinseyi TaxID=2817044 RepID=UPI00143D0ED2|nr:interaptin-like [Belonocnema kinseyi]